MQLYFLRHGESANNLLYAETGSWNGRSEDPWLTERGERQAALLGQFLRSAGFGITHLYSSLLVRAARTASHISEALELPILGWTDIHEGGGVYNYLPGDYGANFQGPEIPKIGLAGKSRSQLQSLFPALTLPSEATEAGWWNQPFEERPARQLRADRVLSRLLEIHGSTQDRVALVSHAGFYNHFMRSLLGIPAEVHVWFHLNNCGLSVIDFGEGDPGDQDTPIGEMRLVVLNRTDYLPPDLIS